MKPNNDSLEIGDLVLVNFKILCKSKKLLTKRMGPFMVLAITNGTAKLQNYFNHKDVIFRNVQFLSPYIHDGEESVVGDLDYEVERIVEEIISEEGTIFYRIRWKGFGEDKDSWRTEEELQFCPKVLSSWKESSKKISQKVIVKRALNKAVISGTQIPSFIATAIPPVNISTESVAPSVTSTETTGNVTHETKPVITLPILTNTTENSTVDKNNNGKKTIITSKGKKKTSLIKVERIIEHSKRRQGYRYLCFTEGEEKPVWLNLGQIKNSDLVSQYLKDNKLATNQNSRKVIVIRKKK